MELFVIYNSYEAIFLLVKDIFSFIKDIVTWIFDNLNTLIYNVSSIHLNLTSNQVYSIIESKISVILLMILKTSTLKMTSSRCLNF